MTVTSNLKCDTAVIGAGATGLSVALPLSEKQKVVVVDAGLLGEGATGWSAGILSSATTVDLRQVESLVGEAEARSLAFFLSDSALQVKHSLGIGENEWQLGSSLYVAARNGHRKLLSAEYNARHRYGLPSEFLEEAHLKKSWVGFPAALEIPGEGAVHPVKLLLHMASAVSRAGGQVFENSPVTSWRHEGDRFIITCNAKTIEAENLVLCPGLKSEAFGELSGLRRLTIPITSRILVTKPTEEIADALPRTARLALWDSLQLYHYLRYLPSGQILVGGAESLGCAPSRQLDKTDPGIQRLYRWAAAHHKFKLPPIEHCWQASLALPADGLPLLRMRQIKENMLAAAVTDGIPFAFVLGRVIAALIDSREHPVARMLSERRRFPLPVRLLSLLPDPSLVRALTCHLAFSALRVKDSLG